MARKELEDVAQALGAEGGGEAPPPLHVEDPHVRGVHAISIHPHSDGKGFLVHHHHQDTSHPDYHHIANLTSHGIADGDALGKHLKEHAPKLHEKPHMAKNNPGMAMGGGGDGDAG